jgi:hypothetical protein
VCPKVVSSSRASGELDGEPLTHERRSMESWDDIASVHGVLVFDESEAAHELDLCNLAGSMLLKMRLHICLRGMAGKIA